MPKDTASVEKTATLYRMVMPNHTCPYGLKSKDLLERRGFRQVDNFTSGNTRYSIQWQPESRQCVQVTIADGRFYDLRDIGRHPKCR